MDSAGCFAHLRDAVGPRSAHFVDLLLRLFLCDIKLTHIIFTLASLSVRLYVDCHMTKFTYTSKTHIERRLRWCVSPLLQRYTLQTTVSVPVMAKITLTDPTYTQIILF